MNQWNAPAQRAATSPKEDTDLTLSAKLRTLVLRAFAPECLDDTPAPEEPPVLTLRQQIDRFDGGAIRSYDPARELLSA